MSGESEATEAGGQAQQSTPAAEIATYAQLELFGHGRDCGRLRDVRVAEVAFLQVERLCELLPLHERVTIYSPKAIYSVRPCDEAFAKSYAEALARQRGLIPAGPALKAGDERPLGPDGRRCALCGCTSIAACVTAEGTCSWMGDRDICSACAAAPDFLDDEGGEDDEDGPGF